MNGFYQEFLVELEKLNYQVFVNAGSLTDHLFLILIMVKAFRDLRYLDLWIGNNLPFLYKTSEPVIASETIRVPLNFLLFHIWLGLKDSNPFPRDVLGLFAFDRAWCRLCLDVNWRFNCGNRALDTLVLPDLFVGCCRYEGRIIFLCPDCRLLFLDGWVSCSSGFIKFLYLCDLI